MTSRWSEAQVERKKCPCGKWFTNLNGKKGENKKTCSRKCYDKYGKN